ncbi:cytochrome P450 [Acrocarpospora corrugata]|uniref:cytochrome P450 n=1 Tax=Acrocarpospora corrugata TaxID=35763 RepID=UPI0012D2FE97|nr:cytochrome P450 [Acrocarpospora corrugata]
MRWRSCRRCPAAGTWSRCASARPRPGWIFTRTTTADALLGGHRIPENTTVIYSPYILRRRADLFDAPDRFDPDRWLPGRVQPGRRT